KTSLLRAGLFPVLRRGGGLPIYTRLSYSNDQADLIKEVETLLLKEIKDQGYNAPPINSKESLWEYFHRVNIKRNDGKKVLPILVFDQFEELFTLGTNDRSTALRPNARALIEFLGDLIENNPPLVLGEEARLRLHYQYGNNGIPVKIVFSFRE